MESPVFLTYAPALGECGQKRRLPAVHSTQVSALVEQQQQQQQQQQQLQQQCDNIQHGGDYNDNNDDDDASIAAMHAMKRLKVNDDEGEQDDTTKSRIMLHDDDNDNANTNYYYYDTEEEDEKSSIASISSIDSCTPPQAQSRPAHAAGLSLEDYPPTPKLNNRTSTRKRAAMLLVRPPATTTTTTTAMVTTTTTPMNSLLGRLHFERQRSSQLQHQQPYHLVHGMDALSMETTMQQTEQKPCEDLYLPVLSEPSSSPRTRQGRRWKVQLQTNSKLES